MLFSFSIRSRMDSSPAYSPADFSVLLLQHLLFLLCVFYCWVFSFVWCACVCVWGGGGGGGGANRVDIVPWV